MKYKLSRLILVPSLFVCVSACTWVKPISQSYRVALLQKADVVNCVKKGATRSKTLSKFIFIPRSTKKMTSEVVTLAKNEAVIMGGDAVVAESKLKAGGQLFGIYLCRND